MRRRCSALPMHFLNIHISYFLSKNLFYLVFFSFTFYFHCNKFSNTMKILALPPLYLFMLFHILNSWSILLQDECSEKRLYIYYQLIKQTNNGWSGLQGVIQSSSKITGTLGNFFTFSLNEKSKCVWNREYRKNIITRCNLWIIKVRYTVC